MAESNRRPPYSRAGFRLGMKLALPLVPGGIALALATGASAARIGLSFFENALMCATVFASAAQLVVMEVWPQHFTLGAIAGMMLIVFTVNTRMLLISASLRPWLGGLPGWIYPTLHLTTDPGWLVSIRYTAQGGRDAGVFFGASVVFAVAWYVATLVGWWLGSLVDPKTFGVDLVMPIFFAAMLVPLWRGRRAAIPWVVAGAVALATEALFGGFAFIVAGAVAGSLTGGFLGEPERD
ncbi:putative branched-chain amino acid transport protein AzlC [Rhodovulum sp. PH10]|uniref:AzlC family ABC transporter permease n=1 Tax=Rhodovulum sp. PH10 TaxID=1187851 RepID=UPI00027C1E03|nr:AzlC family ABC transporter permease [Rhodovulum sp. PH10]EJW12490.1 putative branched-chain amino acid transport protein AzlC [Rhodovulum sp. PH10]